MKPKCNTFNCEVVESWADGQKFWYCRTCKIEVESAILPFETETYRNACTPRNKRWFEEARLKLTEDGYLEIDKTKTLRYYIREHERQNRGQNRKT